MFNLYLFGLNLWSNQLMILSFSNVQILEKAQAIGVSLGESSQDRYLATKIIKDNKFSRTLTVLEHNALHKYSADNTPANLFISNVSNLCEDLADEEIA